MIVSRQEVYVIHEVQCGENPNVGSKRNSGGAKFGFV